MEITTAPSTARVALKAGLITALVLIIYSVVLNMIGISTNSPLHYVAFLFLIGGIVYGMKEFREQNQGYLGYGQGLSVGSLTSGVAGLVSGIFSTIYLKFVDDSAVKRAFDEQRIQMEEKGMSDEQIDQAMKIAEGIAPFSFLFSFLFMLFIGFILSLVIAAIMKKDQDVLNV